jgi:hypothetical protein
MLYCHISNYLTAKLERGLFDLFESIIFSLSVEVTDKGIKIEKRNETKNKKIIIREKGTFKLEKFE